MDDVLLRAVVVLRRAGDDLARTVEELEVRAFHEIHLEKRLVARDDGREPHAEVKRREVGLLVRWLRDDALDEPAERLHEREEDDSAADREDRVRHGDRRHHVGERLHLVARHHDCLRYAPLREHGLPELHEKREEPDKRDGAEQVRESMRKRGALRVGRAADRGDPAGRRRADVRAEEDGYRNLVGDEPLRRHRHRDRDRRGRRLYDGREEHRAEGNEKDAGHVLGAHAREDRRHFGVLADRRDALRHYVEPEEDEPEAYHREPQVVDALAAQEEVQDSAQGEADEAEELRIGRVGDDPHRRRRADVGADENRERLRESHEGGRHEADEHHGDYRRRLDDHRRDDARAHADDAVARRLRHEPAQSPAGRRLKALGQVLHPEQEEPETAEERWEDCPEQAQVPPSSSLPGLCSFPSPMPKTFSIFQG